MFWSCRWESYLASNYFATLSRQVCDHLTHHCSTWNGTQLFRYTALSVMRSYHCCSSTEQHPCFMSCQPHTSNDTSPKPDPQNCLHVDPHPGVLVLPLVPAHAGAEQDPSFHLSSDLRHVFGQTGDCCDPDWRCAAKGRGWHTHQGRGSYAAHRRPRHRWEGSQHALTHQNLAKMQKACLYRFLGFR